MSDCCTCAESNATGATSADYRCSSCTEDAMTTQPDTTELRAAAVAEKFHEAYERLAPDFGYKTRDASAVPWVDVPDANRRLMTAVVAEVLAALLDENTTLRHQIAAARALADEWRCISPETHTDCKTAKLRAALDQPTTPGGTDAQA